MFQFTRHRGAIPNISPKSSMDKPKALHGSSMLRVSTNLCLDASEEFLPMVGYL